MDPSRIDETSFTSDEPGYAEPSSADAWCKERAESP
jgi:hypothetical protein